MINQLFYFLNLFIINYNILLFNQFAMSIVGYYFNNYGNLIGLFHWISIFSQFEWMFVLANSLEYKFLYFYKLFYLYNKLTIRIKDYNIFMLLFTNEIGTWEVDLPFYVIFGLKYS